MVGFLKIKTLVFGFLLASPFVAIQGFKSRKSLEVNHEVPPVVESVSRIPVEVIAEGSAPQWVYVQVGNQAIPEPGALSLFALATLLLAFRRQRN